MTAAAPALSEETIASRFGELIKKAADAFGSDATYAADIVGKARATSGRKRRTTAA